MNHHSVNQVIKNDLVRFEKALKDILADPIDTSLGKPTQDLASYLLKYQGKHLRPRLLFLSTRALGGEVKQLQLDLALIIELIHNASLLHDDILDDAVLRRHQSTFNTYWNNETAILYGDYLLTRALGLINQLSSFPIRQRIIQVTHAMCCGELAHTRQKFNLSLTEPRYLNIIKAKTALLFELACHLGSHCNQTKTKTKLINALTNYGLNFGMAYQITDDCADLISTERSLGKTIGCDFSKGRITLPLIRLIQSTPKNKKTNLQKFITTNTFPAKKKKIFKLLNQTGALSYSYSKTIAYIKKAQTSLTSLKDSPYKQSLLLMAENILPPISVFQSN